MAYGMAWRNIVLDAYMVGAIPQEFKSWGQMDAVDSPHPSTNPHTHAHTHTCTHTRTRTQLPEDGGPLTIQWMQKRLQEITSERSRILNDKRNDNTKLAKHKESVLSELEKLRALNRAHRRLMVEIWQHLTALARVGGLCVCVCVCLTGLLC